MNEDDPEHASNFKGKVFAASDSYLFRKQSNFANPLFMGTDLAALSRIQERIHQLQLDGELPSSYDVHNPVQLLPERAFDTSNRSTVVGAQRNAFDPDGFRSGRPLKKTIFYLDPFVTCAWCNMVTFVDVMAIRRSLAMGDEVRKSLDLALETLPPCRKCGKAEFLEVGSHDFSELIANRDKVAKEKARRELAAALKIQKAFREYLRRAYARAAAAARLALAKLQAKAATRINACVRYRLAQRRIVAERHLLCIKTAHPVLLVYALKQPKKADRRFNYKAKTYWFEREVELNMAFRDYIGLAERLGWLPTRAQMEANFIELSKRIVARQDDLLSLVQRAWRGFMARRIVMYYRTEVIRLRQFLLSKAFKIQRIWRAHRVRLNVVPQLKRRLVKEKQEKEYFEFRDKKRLKKERADAIILTKAAYVKERAEERTARYTGRIDVATDHDDRKMKAFAASIYSDSKLQDQMDNLLSAELMAIASKKEEIEEAHARKEFILARIAETGPAGLGRRSEMPDPSTQKIVNGFALGGPLLPPRSRSMKALLHHEVVEIMDGVIECATHNFVIPNLHNRLKAFNAERAVGKRVGSPIKGKHGPKVTEAGLGGLLYEKKGGSGGSALTKQQQQAQMRKQQHEEEEDDDLGGTGSAFDGDEDSVEDMCTPPPSRGSNATKSPLGRGLSPMGAGQAQARVDSAGSPGAGGSAEKQRFKNSGMGSSTGGYVKQGDGEKKHRLFKDYKFPSGINVDPMSFLNEDMDLILAHADAKAKIQQAQDIEEENSKIPVRSKQRQNKLK